MVPEHLTAHGVSLVPYTLEHDEQTVAWLNDPSLRQTFGITRPVTLSSHRAWLTEQKDYLLWAVITPPSNHQGNLSLQISPRHKSAYFQIYLGNADARGKGIGYKALTLVLGHAFDHLDLHRIWLHTSPHNDVAIALYKKTGFSLEGVERESILRDGVFHDQWRWALLVHEWKSNQI